MNLSLAWLIDRLIVVGGRKLDLATLVGLSVEDHYPTRGIWAVSSAMGLEVVVPMIPYLEGKHLSLDRQVGWAGRAVVKVGVEEVDIPWLRSDLEDRVNISPAQIPYESVAAVNTKGMEEGSRTRTVTRTVLRTLAGRCNQSERMAVEDIPGKSDNILDVLDMDDPANSDR